METDNTEGGYDATFCDPVSDDLLCGICHLPFCAPQQLPCGHQFCKACWMKYLKMHNIKNLCCPMDRQSVAIDRVFPDKAAERRVLSLKVMCKAGDGNDCDWKGELRSLAEHVKTCDFEFIYCTSLGCSQRFQRRYLENHLSLCDYRKMSCKYCSREYLGKNEALHFQTCFEIPVDCVNACGVEKIPRKKMSKHLSKCKLSSLPCSFSHVGCEFKGKEDVRQQHETDSLQQHLSLSTNYIQVLEEKNRSLEGRISELECNNNIGSMLWMIEGYRGKLAEARKAFESLSGIQKIFGLNKENYFSPPFMTHKCGYKLRLYANLHYNSEGKVAFGIQVMKGKYDAILEWPFNLPYEIALLSHGNELRKKACLVNPSFNPNYTRPVENNNHPLYHMSIQPVHIESGNFIVDDTIYVRCVMVKDKPERANTSSSSSHNSSSSSSSSSSAKRRRHRDGSCYPTP